MMVTALKEEASGFVVKPFKKGRVLDTVQRLTDKNVYLECW